ncbi:MAG: TolC family protein [Wenyingzhuangia sp.]|uniref:TolC family protein n=1 Tax=Wenyingzhuangia sp. TaxID=1964193 RepID=UPI00321B6F02
MNKIIYILLMLIGIKNYAQTKAQEILTYQEFIFNVISEHPLAKSAELKEKVAKAKLLAAKGGLDPYLTSSINQKNFENKEYYNIFENKITIPTSLGIAITGSFNNNSGEYLNPEAYTNNNGIWSAGIELDLLQGLITNTRKIALDQAKVYQRIAKNKQLQLVNKLVYDASKAYAEWQQFNSICNILQSNVELSERYLTNIKNALTNGEKTAIDTLEANVYLQNNRINLLKYEQKLVEKRLKVENYLWYENIPVAMQSHVQPETNINYYKFEEITVDENLDDIPMIAEKRAKMESLRLKQKLNREKLKPKLKLKYNPIIKTTDNTFGLSNYLSENQVWGAKLTFPIFFRSERGKYRESKYAVEEINYDIAVKKKEIENKMIANEQNQEALTQQIKLLQMNIDGYEKLLVAETKKFEYGESSLFLINKRQENLIASELKLLSSQNMLIINYLNYLLMTNTIVPTE